MNKGLQEPLRFAVLGHPIAHSRSPRMHAANFAALDLTATYTAFDVTEERLGGQLSDLQQAAFSGVNLTIPLKARALELVDEATPLARLLGGVNTLTFRPDGRRSGDNTDGFGFVESLREAGFGPLAGRRVLVLGCGGTGRALALTCAQAGAGHLVLANRTRERAESVAATIREVFPSVCVEILPATSATWETAASTCDLIVHTTSQGLHAGDAPILTQRAFHGGQMLFDAVYTARHTPLMHEAEAAGARAINGIGMLVHQGAQSFRIWTGREPDVAAMRNACENSPDQFA